MIRKLTTWETFLIFIQVIYLLLILGFAYQQKYPQALGLAIFSGISLRSKKKRAVVNLLNKITWSLAVFVMIYWSTQ